MKVLVINDKKNECIICNGVSFRVGCDILKYLMLYILTIITFFLIKKMLLFLKKIAPGFTFQNLVTRQKL